MIRYLVKFVKFFLVLSCSACILVYALLTLSFSNIGKGERDLSADFKRGHVVGKEYEIKQDMYVAQFYDSPELHCMDHSLKGCCHTYNKKGERIEFDPYALCITMPKGSKFRVYAVVAETSFGQESCFHKVQAHFIDANGNPLEQKNSFGTPLPINVTSLFNDNHHSPGQDWVFHPQSTLIVDLQNL